MGQASGSELANCRREGIERPVVQNWYTQRVREEGRDRPVVQNWHHGMGRDGPPQDFLLIFIPFIPQKPKTKQHSFTEQMENADATKPFLLFAFYSYSWEEEGRASDYPLTWDADFREERDG